MSPGERLMSRMTGSWDSGVWILVGQCQVTLGQARCFGTVTLKLRASVINTTLGQDSNWTQMNSDQSSWSPTNS